MKENLHIAMLLGSVRFGGGERVLERLMLDLLKRGDRVTILTYRNEWESYVSELQGNVEVVSLRHLPTLRRKAVSFLEMRRLLRQLRPDVLLTFEQILAETAVPAARSAGIPTVVSERCDPRWYPVKKIHRLWRSLTFRLADRIVFQTEDVKKYFPGAISRKGVVIPNPILDENLPEPLPAESRRKEIVAIGTLSPVKNFGSLIRSFSAMEDKSWRLTIYGEGPEREALRRVAEKCGVSDRVNLPGNVERVVDHIREASVMVISSRSEGLPNALIEAMAMGLACVSTDFASGGARWLFSHGAGMLVEVDPRQRGSEEVDEPFERRLTIALNTLIGTPAELRRLQQAGPAVRELLRADKVVSQWRDAIQF